jgi:hypothetical protein
VSDVGKQIEEVQNIALAAGGHQQMAGGSQRNALDHLERDSKSYN